MSDEEVSFTGNKLAAIVSEFRELKPLSEQFIAFGMVAELIMKEWPTHIRVAMLDNLQIRLGLFN